MHFRRIMKNHKDIILFLNISFITNRRILYFIEENLLDNFLYLNEKSLKETEFLTDEEKDRLLVNLGKVNLDMVKNRLYSQNIKYVTILDENYPKRLNNIFDPPAILYYRGNLEKLRNPIAVVGARKATDYGIWATNKIISELRGYDISIVSGMALGIDRAAHIASIKNKLFTAGVIASSIDVQYPKRNRDLYQQMQDNLLLSEYAFDIEPLRRNFVIRNRIISGLSLGVLVVEANESSGSLITASFAIEQNKDVFAVPGNISSLSSQGPNMLIAKGASIITSGKDLINQLPFIKESTKVNNIQLNNLNLTMEEIKVYELLKVNILGVDDLIKLTNLSISSLYVILTKLEMNRLVDRLPSGKYSLKI